MRAAVFTKPRACQIVERELPMPAERQALVRVEACGVCGTDAHVYRGEFPARFPLVAGHEFAGEVVEVGKEVTKFQPGDRVTCIPFFRVCGKCRFCRHGHINLCMDRKSAGTHVNGAFTKYVLMTEGSMYRIPEGISYEEAAVSEPLAFNVWAVLMNTKILPGDTVLVSGPGTIGLLATQCAKAAGATVITAGTVGDEYRLGVAREVGADFTVDVSKENLLEIMMDMTDGCGVDVAIECSGAPPSVAQCVDAVRKGGQITQMGLFSNPVPVDLNKVTLKEVSVQGIFATRPVSWDRALELLGKGKIRTRPLITSKLPLSQWESAFSSFGKGKEIKILLHPDD